VLALQVAACSNRRGGVLFGQALALLARRRASLDAANCLGALSAGAGLRSFSAHLFSMCDVAQCDSIQGMAGAALAVGRLRGPGVRFPGARAVLSLCGFFKFRCGPLSYFISDAVFQFVDVALVQVCLCPQGAAMVLCAGLHKVFHTVTWFSSSSPRPLLVGQSMAGFECPRSGYQGAGDGDEIRALTTVVLGPIMVVSPDRRRYGGWVDGAGWFGCGWGYQAASLKVPTFSVDVRQIVQQ